MNDLTQPLKFTVPHSRIDAAGTTSTTGDEAERYLRDGHRVLELARRRVHELDTLISGHTAELARLRDIIARLEALRDG